MFLWRRLFFLRPFSTFCVTAGSKPIIHFLFCGNVGLSIDLIFEELKVTRIVLQLSNTIKVTLRLHAYDFIQLVMRIDLLEDRLWAVNSWHIFFFLNRRSDHLVLPIELLEPKQQIERDAESNDRILVQRLVHQHFGVAPRGALQEPDHNDCAGVVRDGFRALLQLLDHGVPLLLDQMEDVGETGKLLHENETKAIVPVFVPRERQDNSFVIIIAPGRAMMFKLRVRLKQLFEFIG